MPWKRALLGVIALYLALQGYSLYIASSLGDTVSIWTAHTLYGGLALLGQHPVLDGADVSAGATLFRVIPECTVFAPLALFVVGVLAFPARPTDKLLAILGGVIVLSLVNVVRLLSLFGLASMAPDSFEAVHWLVWQPLMAITALALWGAWARKVTQGG
jgi:exosortase/archaeosortase family protein